MKVVRDETGNFLGFEPRECGEHRTVGDHRAWCYDCGEWCYPSIPCVRCEIADLRKKVAEQEKKEDVPFYCGGGMTDINSHHEPHKAVGTDKWCCGDPTIGRWS